jgi:hypothetical protein
VITDEDVPTQALGAHGEPCPGCGAPLASDQRYCLNCGRRRAGARVPYADLLAGRAPDEVLTPVAPPPPPPPPPERRSFPPATIAVAAAGVGALVLALGVLLGAATDSDQPRQLAAAPVQKPAVINVNAAAAPAAATDETFVSDWPEGEDGWTVQLQTLDKASSAVTDVAAAKTAATGKGATDVGALDSDDWPSLDAGIYVVYSGVFTGKGAKGKAQAAIKELKKDFPDAKVVEVSAAGAVPGAEGTKAEEKPQKVDQSELQDLEGATGEEQQKKSAKLPPTVQLEGEAPPKDDKEAGGGSDAEVIQ